jgi:hypothetical protein
MRHLALAACPWHPAGAAGWRRKAGMPMETPRPNDDRFRPLKTGFAVIRFVLWLSWLIWTVIDQSTR